MDTAREQATETSRGRRILVVDDDGDACDILTQLVRHLGHEPVCMQDSAEALRRLHAEPWDIVLLDLVMPGLNGFDLLRATRVGPRPRVPVVAISSYGELRHEAERIGFTAFMEKPVELAKLRPVLERLLPAG